MELDDLKTIWAQYDKKLTDNLKFNEELLRKINIDKSKREMNTPFGYEIFSLVAGGLFLLFVLSWTYSFAGETKYLISGLVTGIICLAGLIFTIQKLGLLSKIDYYNTPVVDLQKDISKFKKKYILYKRGEVYIFPIFAIIAMPIVAKGVRNLDLFEHHDRYIFAIVLSLILYYPLAILFYKNVLDKKLRNTTIFLEELTKFEKEE